MPHEIKPENGEQVVRSAPDPADQVYTDPVSGEVVRTGPAEPARYPVSAREERLSGYTVDRYAARWSAADRIQRAIYLVFGIVEALIAVRFVLEVLAANPRAGFAHFIYGVTAFFMAPFTGLFGTPRFGSSVVEWSALVAIMVYALLAALLVRLVWLVIGDSAGRARRAAIRTEHVDVDTRRER